MTHFNHKESPVPGFTHPVLSEYPRLRLHKIDESRLIVIDPENAFWAVLRNDSSLERELKEKILPLYVKHKAEIDEEIRRFRFDIELSAVYINPTDRCNGRCQYCYIPESIRTEGRNMSREDLFYALDMTLAYFKARQTDADRKPVVVFHGSEPLMVKSLLFEAIRQYKDKILFGIQTNATMMDEDDARFLMDNRVSVGLSLDSLDRGSNNGLRPMVGQRSAYDAVMDAIGWLNGYKGMNVITTITSHNVHELPDIVRFLHHHGVKAALLNPIRCTRQETIALRPDQTLLYRYFKEAVDTAYNLTVQTGRKIVVSGFTNTILAIAAPIARRLMCDITPCGGARRFFYIMADTTTTPCGEFIANNDFRAGSIREHSFEEILASKPFQDVRGRIVESIEECSQCLYRNICGAPCPGEIQETDGTFFAPSPYCSFYKQIIDYAFKLISEGKTPHLLRDEMSASMDTVYTL
ncbi:MAG TPA: peptide-modifying radical SAM enzyme CbpB [Thermodesulfovibrionia bacterium]|nr:peptide-modifying radical SAM enzyme CbpB [Thermodesulfovibrionia bacterium]